MGSQIRALVAKSRILCQRAERAINLGFNAVRNFNTGSFIKVLPDLEMSSSALGETI